MGQKRFYLKRPHLGRRATRQCRQCSRRDRRLVDATAKKMAGEFFASFAEVVGGPAPEEAAAPAAEAAPPPALIAGVRPLFWVLGLVAIVAILLAVFA